MGMYMKAVGAGGSDDKEEYVPPVVGFTHTQAPLAPPTNDNVVVSPFSGFWGGATTDNIGAFAQVTYNAPPAGGFSDPFGHTWTWNNTDVRYAREMTIGLGAIFGITANNNPSRDHPAGAQRQPCRARAGASDGGRHRMEAGMSFIRDFSSSDWVAGFVVLWSKIRVKELC
jgi:hypothetical protein